VAAEQASAVPSLASFVELGETLTAAKDRVFEEAAVLAPLRAPLRDARVDDPT